MEYDSSNSGALFKNDKEGNEKRPDYKGYINIDGVKRNVSAWIQTAKGTGEKFMSLKNEKHIGPASGDTLKKQPVATVDEDIPF